MQENAIQAAKPETNAKLRRSNMRVAAACLGFVGGMVGMAYASVPLYQLFCAATGFGGTPMIAESAPAASLERMVHVRFDSNTAPGIAWRFEPKQREVTVKLGETVEIAFVAENTTSYATTGTATFNVTPATAGAYFNKMQCFCFTDTTLKPGEKIDMPVVFFVDPSIVDDPEASKISTITLSYTFFPSTKDGSVNNGGAGAQASVKLKTNQNGGRS